MRIREDNEVYPFTENEGWGEEENLSHKRIIRKRLEEKLERRRLRNELEDYDEDDDWDNLDQE